MGKRANPIAKDLRCSNGKYRMRVEPSSKRYNRNDEVAVVNDELAEQTVAEAEGQLSTFVADLFE